MSKIGHNQTQLGMQCNLSKSHKTMLAISNFRSLKRLLLLFSAALASAGFAQNNYVAFELNRENNWDQLITEDVNGDGAKDIIFAHFDPNIGRELRIHHQQSDGNFTSNPQRIEIKTEIIAVGFADLRTDPGKELILLANSGVFSLSTAIEGYAGNLKQLFQWDLIAAIPDLAQVQFMQNIQDINGDGHVDLLLPGETSYGLFLGTGNEEFELAADLQTTNDNLTAVQRNYQESALNASIGINPDKGVVVELNTSTTTPFSGFIELWEPKSTESRALLRTENWMPTAVVSELNGDNLQDIIYLNIDDEGLGQLNIHYQNDDQGYTSQPDWQASMETRGDMRLVDIDKDGRLDLLRLTGDGSDWDARFFLNQNGEFNLQQPNQIMRFSGYDVRLNFIQLSLASKPVLNVSFYTIPVVDAIRNASIKRTQLLYSAEDAETGQVFARRPSSSLEESFSATNVRGLSEQMSLRFDVDGDGASDAMYITENGTLAAKKINAQLQIAEQPFWEYVSPRTVFEFEVTSLNQDGIPDLVLRHGTTTTLLVATP
jgi:hypothetical protein